MATVCHERHADRGNGPQTSPDTEACSSLQNMGQGLCRRSGGGSFGAASSRLCPLLKSGAWAMLSLTLLRFPRPVHRDEAFEAERDFWGVVSGLRPSAGHCPGGGVRVGPFPGERGSGGNALCGRFCPRGRLPMSTVISFDSSCVGGGSQCRFGVEGELRPWRAGEGDHQQGSRSGRRFESSASSTGADQQHRNWGVWVHRSSLGGGALKRF